MKPTRKKLLPRITVHGRFQPPLHINHWDYIAQGFNKAEHVTILITNPYNDESYDSAAAWRNDPANNPFTFDERVYMLGSFFSAKGIDSSRYTFQPFNIKDPAAFKKLDVATPNLVNVYSEWSAKKVDSFQKNGHKVIRLDKPKSVPISGTMIRQIINNGVDQESMAVELVRAGYMPEAIPGLMKILEQKGSI